MTLKICVAALVAARDQLRVAEAALENPIQGDLLRARQSVRDCKRAFQKALSDLASCIKKLQSIYALEEELSVDSVQRSALDRLLRDVDLDELVNPRNLDLEEMASGLRRARAFKVGTEEMQSQWDAAPDESKFALWLDWILPQRGAEFRLAVQALAHYRSRNSGATSAALIGMKVAVEEALFALASNLETALSAMRTPKRLAQALEKLPDGLGVYINSAIKSGLLLLDGPLANKVNAGRSVAEAVNKGSARDTASASNVGLSDEEEESVDAMLAAAGLL